MKRTKYIMNAGRMSRKDNTLMFTPIDKNGKEGTKKSLPIKGVANLYCFGSLDANSAMYNFLGQKKVAVHFFDFYEHYTGSFFPKEKLLSGKVTVKQTQCYLQKKRRLYIAQQFVKGSVFNMLHNLKGYYRKGRPVDDLIQKIELLEAKIDITQNIPELMGIEGNCRKNYYDAFDDILIGTDFLMQGRSKQPPKNEVNALISFGNTMCYTLCMDAIYHTSLNPTVSFLHEPGARRYSLALDIAEIFKPILIDRLIFRLINKKQIQPKHFEQRLNGCFLNDKGRAIFLKAYDENLRLTIKHPTLKRKVSYRHLVVLECHKLLNYIVGAKPHYKPYKIH